MNIWLLTVTFLAVNLDFFVLLLFLLKKFSVRQVVVGYLSGVVLLLVASFLAGKVLAQFLPEWLLGYWGSCRSTWPFTTRMMTTRPN